LVTNLLPSPGQYNPSVSIRGPGFSNWRVTTDLISTFEEDDIRRDIIVTDTFLTDDGTKRKVDYAFTLKFADPVASQNNNDTGAPYVFSRYADLLLMLAEAENEKNGPTELAYNSLNAVRERAGLDPVSGLTQEELREAIRMERRRELYFEGHRAFDLKRWGELERVAGVAEKQAVVTETDYLLPLPSGVLTANIQQNPGY
jgi:hypothetical protein